MHKNDQMAPDASPGAASKKSGVRRVNNMPMYILAAVAGTFLLVMALVAADRAAKQNAPADKSLEKAGSTSIFAKEIAGEQTGGIIEPAQPPKEATPTPASAPLQGAVSSPEPNFVLQNKAENLDKPLARPIGRSQSQTERDEEADRIRMQKFQMLEEAVKAKTSVQIVSAPGASGAGIGTSTGTGTPRTRDEMLARLSEVRQEIDNAGNDDPTSAYQARLSQIRSMGIGGMSGAGVLSGGSPAVQHVEQTRLPAAGSNSYGQFAGAGEGDRWALDSKPEAPRSPYELRAGFVMPATLITGINSELPGQIMAQASQNVYDTPTGRYLLIPQGSRLIGTYSSNIAYGQARVLVAWQRIVFPDGKAMDIDAMPGADSAGYSGFNDKVNNHYFRIYSSALLMSAVTAGVALSQNKDTGRDDTQRAGDVLSEALGQQLGQVTAQMIAKNLNIAPTLEIRPGYRFNVIVTKDMTFLKPYQSFDY